MLKTVHIRHKAAANMEKVKKNILGHLQVHWKEVPRILAFHWLTKYIKLRQIRSAKEMPVFRGRPSSELANRRGQGDFLL